MDLKVQAELHRLRKGPIPSEKAGGLGTVRFVARCPVGARDVLSRVIAVLQVIDESSPDGWPSNEEWARKLPKWFISACAPAMTQDEAERWLAWWKALPAAEQAKAEAEKEWSLDNWLYWMRPENRQWFWWDGKTLDDCGHIMVAVAVEDWPFAWGSLRWLFKAAGASALDAED